MNIERLFGPRSLCRSWVGTAVVGGLALGVGGAIASATSDGPSVDNTFLQNPEYPNSQAGRDLWWNKLQEWGNDPNYGAIAPDWNDIWDQTQQKVKQYYNGGPLAPGVQDRINSSLARRGMSENPASDFLHAQVGAQEAQDLKGLAVDQNTARNNFAEQGRAGWLTSLQNFQAQKPAGQWNTTVTEDPQAQFGQALSSIGGAVGSAGLQVGSLNNQTAYLDKLLKTQSGPQSFAPAIKPTTSSIKWTDF